MAFILIWRVRSGSFFLIPAIILRISIGFGVLFIRSKFAQGSPHHGFNPFRYFVRRASHPIISAMAACLLRELTGICQVLSRENPSSTITYATSGRNQRTTQRRANNFELRPPRFFPSAEVTGSAMSIRVYQRLSTC